MAFTEKYVKAQSTRWDTATAYVVNDQCSGSDDKNYYCIKNQSADEGADPPAAGYDEWWTVSDGTTEVRAWTFAEMIAAAPAAGSRVNIKAGSYSVGTTTLPSSGTYDAPIVLRGYSSTIGDLDNQGRSADGTLDTTNMPDIAITGLWTPSPYCILQSLDISGALSSALIGSTSADYWGMVCCRVVNSQNNSSASCVQGDDSCSFVNCDLSCTGASHTWVIDFDNYCLLHGCRVAATLDTATVIQTASLSCFVSCCIFGAGNTSIGIKNTGSQTYVIDTSFYNCGIAIQTPNGAVSGLFVVANCHITDCGKYIDNLYAATANHSFIEAWNRTRDNTTPRTGIESACLVKEVTTDDGDYTTDYVSETNLRLLATAAGASVGMMPYTDIGAHRHADPAGGGGKRCIIGG